MATWEFFSSYVGVNEEFGDIVSEISVVYRFFSASQSRVELQK